MVNHITTISLNDGDLEIISKYNLSPTALIKERLQDMRHLHESVDVILKEMQRKVDVWKQITDDCKAFIEKKGLTDEFLKK